MKFKDELEEIREMVHDQLPRYLIIDKCNEKIAGYQKEIDEFEKWADEESKKQENMAVPDDIGQDGGVENFG
jgi:uncharacterized membrane protein (DUF106 family)